MSLKHSNIVKTLLLIVLFVIIPMILQWQNSPPDVHALDKQMARVAEESEVIRVVDGDTIIVALNHKPETVRLIGVNTPETVAPNRPVQCYGKEASAYTKNLLDNKIVRLETDPTQDNRDKYDRLLRYVWTSSNPPPLRVIPPLPEGRVWVGREEGGLKEELVNESLVRDGYAREYTYKIPYKYQQQFRADQRIAKKEKRGLWGMCN